MQLVFKKNETIFKLMKPPIPTPLNVDTRVIDSTTLRTSDFEQPQMYTLRPQSKLLHNICSTRLQVFHRPAFSPITTIRMASSQQPSKRRFAPLGQPASEDAPALQGIVFDMDGTLCKSYRSLTISTRG